MSRPEPKNFSSFHIDKRNERPMTSSSPAVEGKKTKNFVEIRKKQAPKSAIYTNEFHELALQQKDQRFRYLLKNGELRKIQKGGNIIFSQLPQIPNIWVCYRRPIERQGCSDKLNLDCLDLNHMPLLQGQQKLKMLTYQHNNISKVQNLISLPNIVYLDLYDNQIKQIDGFDSVRNLKVLLLAKNHISKLRNLSQMTKLQVLDVHSNKISKIQGLSNLVSLKVLNLSHNGITKIQNLDHVIQLSQLNLKSNAIIAIEHIKHLSKLQKVFLSNNKIQLKNHDGCDLTKLPQLKQLSIQNNPCSERQQCKNMINGLYYLKICDGKPVKRQKQSLKQKQRESFNEIEDEYDHSDVLKLITKQWQEEKNRVLALQKNGASRKQILKSSCITGGHAEIEDEAVLFIFGNSYEAVLSDPRYYESVEKIKFEYVLFEFIIEPSILGMLKKFKKLRSLEFKKNHISSLLQIAKLQALPSLKVITIDKEDNPLYQCSFLKQFIVYRFPTVAVVNRLDVKQSDRTKAKALFHNFDRMLQIPQKFFSPQNLKQYPSQPADAKKDKAYLKSYTRCINETAQSQTADLVQKAARNVSIKRQFETNYEQAIYNIIGEIDLQ